MSSQRELVFSSCTCRAEKLPRGNAAIARLLAPQSKAYEGLGGTMHLRQRAKTTYEMITQPPIKPKP